MIGSEEGAAADAATPIAPVERLRAMSLVDLQALANRSRIPYRRADKHTLVTALLPHLEHGTITLENWIPFQLPHEDFPNAVEEDD